MSFIRSWVPNYDESPHHDYALSARLARLPAEVRLATFFALFASARPLFPRDLGLVVCQPRKCPRTEQTVGPGASNSGGRPSLNRCAAGVCRNVEARSPS